MISQVEEFLDDLYDTDRHTHQLVNQAILELERNGLPKDDRSSTPSPHQRSRT